VQMVGNAWGSWTNAWTADHRSGRITEDSGTGGKRQAAAFGGAGRPRCRATVPTEPPNNPQVGWQHAAIMPSCSGPSSQGCGRGLAASVKLPSQRRETRIVKDPAGESRGNAD
jgi:hypothetical protein